jgi:hypothetical protein
MVNRMEKRSVDAGRSFCWTMSAQTWTQKGVRTVADTFLCFGLRPIQAASHRDPKSHQNSFGFGGHNACLEFSSME